MFLPTKAASDCREASRIVVSFREVERVRHADKYLNSMCVDILLRKKEGNRKIRLLAKRMFHMNFLEPYAGNQLRATFTKGVFDVIENDVPW